MNNELPDATVKVLVNIMKNFSEKSAQKRKDGQIEFEKLIMTSHETDEKLVPTILNYVKVRLIKSSASKYKKPALMGLAGVCNLIIKIQKESIEIILEAAVQAMMDDDVRIRFSACDSLYNILNICRTELIDDLCLIFDNYLVLVTDKNEEIKKAVNLVDTKLKEVVKECLSKNMLLDMKSLVGLICVKMNTDNPNVRSLLVSWLELLSSIPNVNLLNCVPMLLPQLIAYVAESNNEVQTKSERQLDSLLSEFGELRCREPQMDLEILCSLVNFFHSNDFKESSLCRFVALTWTRNFLSFIKKDAKEDCPEIADMWLRIYPKLVDSILKFINDSDRKIKDLASVINKLLQDLVSHVVRNKESLSNLIKTIVPHLQSKSLESMILAIKQNDGEKYVSENNRIEI